jgi:hypothetical protein
MIGYRCSDDGGKNTHITFVENLFEMITRKTKEMRG